jgi:hypothetical protein
MEPFEASRSKVRKAKPLKEMVGTRRLELLTSTVPKLRPVHFLGQRYIRRLIEHELRGNPAHRLQHVPQSRTDFQFARRTEATKTVQTTCDNADQFLNFHPVIA